MDLRTVGLVAALIATAAARERIPITSSGWGAVRIGMTAAEAKAAMGGDLKLAEGDAESDCYYLGPSREPSPVFMVESGRVVRVETWGRELATPSGVRVGDSEARVRRIYRGRYTVDGHQYVDDGHYFVIRTADRARAVVVETYDGKVQSIRGGEFPAVMYVEGCQ